VKLSDESASGAAASFLQKPKARAAAEVLGFGSGALTWRVPSTGVLVAVNLMLETATGLLVVGVVAVAPPRVWLTLEPKLKVVCLGRVNWNLFI
jgi:hypothetical protein